MDDFFIKDVLNHVFTLYFNKAFPMVQLRHFLVSQYCDFNSINDCEVAAFPAEMPVKAHFRVKVLFSGFSCISKSTAFSIIAVSFFHLPYATRIGATRLIISKSMDDKPSVFRLGSDSLPKV